MEHCRLNKFNMNEAVQKRLALLGNVEHRTSRLYVNPEHTMQIMECLEAFRELGETIASATKNVEHDAGRLIHAIDLLQQAQHVFIDALTLPHVKPAVY
jgi:hypothetical protein